MDACVSVIIPTYNRASLLGRAICSVLAAVEPGDEILVVDDGSSDNTEQVVASFGERVRFVRGPHRGAGAARNHGIQHASRPLLAFLDDDDEWDADKLLLQRAVLRVRPDLLFCCTDFRGINADGSLHPHNLINWRPEDPRPWQEILGQPRRLSEILEPTALVPARCRDCNIYISDFYRGLMETFLISAITLVVRREAGDALHFGEDVPCYEDLEFFARVARVGRGAFIDCDTATQHGHAGPRLTDANTEVLTRARLTVLDRVWGHDEVFLKEHGAHYQHQVRRLHLTRAKWLLVRGRTQEAREELRQAGDPPTSYRLLAALPGAVTRGLLSLRRAIRPETGKT